MDNHFEAWEIGTFLLRMIQLQAAIQDYSINIYLQTNLGTETKIWYENRGFKKISNAVSMLPPQILNLIGDSKNINYN